MMELLVTCFVVNVFSRNEVSVLAVPPPVDFDTIICTKNPNEWAVIPQLLECDPDQYFIFMLRDPRDVIVSRHKLRPNMYWANLRQWHSSWNAIKEYINHERLIVIYYEDLVKRPDETQRQFSANIPFLKQKLLFSQYHLYSKPSRQSLIAMNNIRPINDASIGKWRDHKSRLVGQLKLHGPIASLLIKLNYETDTSWLAELDGVREDISPGFWPDFIPEEKQLQHKLQLNKLLAEYKNKRGLTG
jgi:hypothetical protein